MTVRLVFIGAGRMASAIIKGLLERGFYQAGEIACTCGDDPTGPALAESTGIQYLKEIDPGALEADAFVLACKPQQFAHLDDGVVEAAKGALVLSILAGTNLKRLASRFETARNIVRTMPNTPGQIGAGVTAFAPLQDLMAEDERTVGNILRALGSFHPVEEAELDAVTALSGSGPAYVFEFTAALREAGIKAGLDPKLAADLALKTVLGAAQLMAQSNDSPEALRDAVTSPGGTTAAALAAFGDAGFREVIEDAVAAAKARSLELAQE